MQRPTVKTLWIHRGSPQYLPEYKDHDKRHADGVRQCPRWNRSEVVEPKSGSGDTNKARVQNTRGKTEEEAARKDQQTSKKKKGLTPKKVEHVKRTTEAAVKTDIAMTPEKGSASLKKDLEVPMGEYKPPLSAYLFP